MGKIKIEKLLYLFVMITPFLDALACLFRNWYPEALFSPATILRPVIPLILLGYIFFKDKKWRKYLIISALLFIIYGIGHLFIYEKLLTGISSGSLFSEAQYVVNYTYMVYVLFIYLYFMKTSGLPYLKKVLFIMLCGYLGMIYISILTGTSYPTYVEGMGCRGWFSSGNSLSAILILLLSLLIDDIFKSEKIYKYVVFLLFGIYLLFLLGTRTGLFGFVLVIGVYVIINLGIKFANKRKIDRKKVIVIGCVVVIGALGVILSGSETIKKEKYLSNADANIIDINTGAIAHTTIDTNALVYRIKNGELDDNYLNKEQKKAYLEMYDMANKLNVRATDKRTQQLLYNIFLIKNQKNIIYILFGNGYLVNYAEMTLEIELLAMLFNFGIIGFLFYIGPFLLVFMYIIKRYMRLRVNLTIDMLLLLFSFFLAIALSFFMCAVFFSTSCALIIICVLVLLYEEWLTVRSQVLFDRNLNMEKNPMPKKLND